MKMFITGGAGFIGSNLAEMLVKKNHEVIVLDNFFLGREENLNAIRNKITLVKGDIRDLDLLLKITKNVDVIFNQAAASSRPMFIKDLKDALSINIDGFVNVMNAAKENNIRRVVYASTSSLYGSNKPPLNEGMKMSPVNFYASSKLMNEHIASGFSTEHGIETVGLRYMSVYGPREEGKGEYANLVSQFLWSMKKNERPVIYGDGKQTRDFVYVKDVCQANILAATVKKKMSGEVFNVGTGKSTSLNDAVSMINSILGKSITPKYVKNIVKNYINTQQADISKIKKELGYSHEYDLKKGIKEIISISQSKP
ncbi:SDR family NAD(P)-dependent oxidoreductase [archaeon]|nr:SDR family NAD(P)-dependent oxidoreductase [archaeon]